MSVTVSLELYNAAELQAFSQFVGLLQERRSTVPRPAPVISRPAPAPAEDRGAVVAAAAAAPAPLYVEGSVIDEAALATRVRAHAAAKGAAETARLLASFGVKRAGEVAPERRFELYKALDCGCGGGA